MRRSRGRVVQVESLGDFDRRVAAGATRLAGWRVRGVDLRDRGAVLAGLRVAGATFLGCTFAPGDEERVEGAGALVLPPLTIAPVDVYRSEPLHRRGAVRRRRRTSARCDGRAYAWSQTRGGADDALARSLHDHAIDEALTAWIAAQAPGRRDGRPRGAARGDAEYADAARLGHALGAHHVVATGGGPGAMEAANLGVLPGRLPRLRASPTPSPPWPRCRRSGPRSTTWLRPALEVCARGRRAARLARDPDLALRPRAVERLRHRHRQVLPQRHARGDPARGLRRRHRLPPRRRRHRPGGLPGRLRELLRRRVLGRRDGPGRARVLDRDPARLAAAARRWPAAAPWRTACTSSTRSTRPSALLAQAASSR